MASRMRPGACLIYFEAHEPEQDGQNGRTLSCMVQSIPSGINHGRGDLHSIRGEFFLELTAHWEFVSDQVMGGVSKGEITEKTIEGRAATCLTGEVSLDNNGGFVQMACDIHPDEQVHEAGTILGIELDVYGNDQEYDIRLRTDNLSRPWQSYRRSFNAPSRWCTVQCLFSEFLPHRTEVPFDPSRLRRLGLVAIGREFSAFIAVSGVRLITKD